MKLSNAVILLVAFVHGKPLQSEQNEDTRTVPGFLPASKAFHFHVNCTTWTPQKCSDAKYNILIKGRH